MVPVKRIVFDGCGSQIFVAILIDWLPNRDCILTRQQDRREGHCAKSVKSRMQNGNGI
jgi:hypothetical protein